MSIKSRFLTRIASFAAIALASATFSTGTLAAQTNGIIVGAQIRDNAASTDTALLDSIHAPAFMLRDGEIFAAAEEVATSGSSSTPARVFALRTLIWIKAPGVQMSYEDLTDPSSRCYSGLPSLHFGVELGLPLPTDYVARLDSVGARLRADTTLAAEVGRAEACLSMFPVWSPRVDTGGPGEYIVVSEDVTLEVVCGNTFRVRSPVEAPLTITYVVVETQEQGQVTVPARIPHGAWGETTFTTASAGTVQLIEEGYVVDSDSTSGTPCSG